MVSVDNNIKNKTEYSGILDESKKESVRLFESLAPSNAITNGQEYFEALDWALKKKDVYNIALSGPYGSGKSSVINSYLERKTSKKYRKKSLKISLATFALKNGTTEPLDAYQNCSKLNETLEQQLEYGILKHLFYSVDTNKIPQSRYRKLQGTKKWISNALYSLFGMVLIILAMYFATPDKIKEFKKAVDGNHKWLIYCFVALMLFISLYIFVNWFRRNIRVREVNLFNKVEIGTSVKDDSIFNKNMDEIMYFFERTKINTVFIEDVDRFNNTKIFVALRELNNLINHNENIKKKVTFIYAVRDDMFIEEGERTKFFDFIIPVVPYISSTNSGEILREKLKFKEDGNKSLIYDISESFISLVSPYIRDTRQLICICNEFNIYKNTLKGRQKLDLNDQNMFALIIFKNLYPIDFAQLEDEQSESIVKSAFRDKKGFVERKAALIIDRKKEELFKLDNIEKEIMKNIREIKVAMLSCLVGNNSSWIYSINNGKKSFEVDEILQDEFDLGQLREKQLNIFYLNKNRSSSSKIVKDIDKYFAEKNERYFERIELCKNGLENGRDTSRKKIEECEIKINDLKSYSIKKIIEEFGIEFLSEKVRSNNLLVFLLRSGFIDENYDNYINYFHPNSISQNEMNFILGIRNHKSSFDYTYPLLHVERVYNMLQDYEFRQPEVLNYNLIDFLLDNRRNSEQADCFFELLSDRSEKSMSFVKAYFNRGICIETFVNELCRNDIYLWQDIITDSGVPKDREYEYLDSIVRFADIIDIQKLDVCNNEGKGVLSTYIENHRDIFSAFKESSIEKQLQVIKTLDIKFYDADLSHIDKDICEDIYSNNRYVINEKMLGQFIAWKKPELYSEVSSKNYSILMNIGFEAVLKYVRDGFDDYLNTIILGVETNIHEDKEAIEDIIERSLVNNHSLCVDVISKQTLVWNDISEVGNGLSEDEFNEILDIWNIIFINNRVHCTWENICKYYDHFGMTDTLAKYINMHYERLDSYVTSEIPTDTFLYDILSAPEFEIDNFVKLIKSSGIEQYTESIEGLSVDKIKALINEKYLKYDIDVFQEIKTFAPTLVIDYVLKNPKEFITKVDSVNISNSEIDVLLKSDQFNTKEKTKLAKMYDLTDLTTENAMTIRDLTVEIERTVTDTAWKLLPEEMRYQLFFNQINSFSNEELPEIFGQFSKEYHQLIVRSNHGYKLPYNEYNDELTQKLLERGYVTSANKHSSGKKNLFGKEIFYIEGRVKQAKKLLL